jgi:hypothetical protein
MSCSLINELDLGQSDVFLNMGNTPLCFGSKRTVAKDSQVYPKTQANTFDTPTKSFHSRRFSSQTPFANEEITHCATYFWPARGPKKNILFPSNFVAIFDLAANPFCDLK